MNDTAATNTPPPRYRLARLEAENFKRLGAIDITFDRRLTEISGRNAQGKSTVWGAIYTCLRGLAEAPDEPIRTGADRCFIRTHLTSDDDPKDGLIITCRFQRGAEGKITEKLTIETPDGARFSSPQKHLDKLISDQLLDPAEFLAKKPAEKLEAFQALIPGIDFAKVEGLNLRDYERRTDVNRLAKEARAAASMIIVPRDTPAEPIDEAALVDQLAEAGDHNAEIESRRGRRERVVERIATLRAEAEGAQSRSDERVATLLSKAIESKAELQRQIDELQARIDRIGLQVHLDQGVIVKEETQRAEKATAEADELQSKLDAAGPLPEPKDAAAITVQITKARETNAAVQRAADRQKHVALAEKYEGESKLLTEGMEARTAAMRAEMAKANLPVPGLEISATAIRLNGQLFEQASTAESYRTVFALALAKRPTVRLFWFRDAGALDDDTLKIIEQLANEFDCYVILETVRAIGKQAIVIDNGYVLEISAEPKATSQEATA